MFAFLFYPSYFFLPFIKHVKFIDKVGECFFYLLTEVDSDKSSQFSPLYLCGI